MDEATLASIHAALVEHARQIDELKAECKEKCESLERKCGVLEARCDSLERSVRVLKKDVSWRYSAHDIPRSHWIEQGHDEEYADYMEDFLRFIKEEVEAIRSGDSHCCGCLDNTYRPTILHDDALLPHFEELADAIQVSDGIQQMNIGDIVLSPSALGILLPAMEGKVPFLYMRRVGFPATMKCYETIAKSIRHNHTLEELVCWEIRISSNEQADLLIESVKDNRSIKNVTMENCFDHNGCRALVPLLTCGRPFEKIGFEENKLSGVDDVAAALATNPQIKILRMSGNELDDRDAELVAQALKQNTNLLELHLDENNFTAAGFETIQAVIYNPSSLNATDACNHTCYVDCVEEDGDYEGGNTSILTPQQRRRRKLYKMLSIRHASCSNAFHLNAELGDGPGITKLVPRVLERVLQFSDDRSVYSPLPISLLFELMKSWKMPELHEHRGSF